MFAATTAPKQPPVEHGRLPSPSCLHWRTPIVRKRVFIDFNPAKQWMSRINAGGDLGRYQYSRTEMDELASMMPARLDAPVQTRSRKVLREVLEKHGLQVDALFEENMFQDFADGSAILPDLSAWLEPKADERASKILDFDFDEYDDDELEEDEDEEEEGEHGEGGEDAEGEVEGIFLPVGPPLPEDDPAALEFLLDSIEEGYEARQDWELQQIFDKGMQLHIAQNYRANNVYAATLWYAQIMRQLEIWDDYEGKRAIKIPPFVRAIFLLEEDFDDLNAKQHELDLIISEKAVKKKMAIFKYWAGENLDISLDSPEPTEEGPPTLALEDADASTLSIDDLLKGTIPNAEDLDNTEGAAHEEVVKDLLEGGTMDMDFRRKSQKENKFTIPILQRMDDMAP